MSEFVSAVSVQTMRESDLWTSEHRIPSRLLMDRAGTAIFQAADWIPPVAIFCGSGNNAGDGYVAAIRMKEAGIPCTLVRVSDRCSTDGGYYYRECLHSKIPEIRFSPDFCISAFGSVLDCLLGTGFAGKIDGIMRQAIELINRSNLYVVSADINSGLNGDTGLSDCCVHSDLTVSIGMFKTGHFSGISNEVMKKRINCDIGIEIIGPIIQMPVV